MLSSGHYFAAVVGKKNSFMSIILRILWQNIILIRIL